MRKIKYSVAAVIIGLALSVFLGTVVVGCGKKKRYYNSTQEVESPKVDENTSELDKLRALIEALTTRVDGLEDKLTECCESQELKSDEFTSSIADIDSRVTHLEDNVGGLKKEGDELILEGCNLRVRDAEDGPLVPGLGNILVGRDNQEPYTSMFGAPPIRDGSNNIIVGGSNEYRGSGGLAVGALNKLLGNSSCVLSCENTSEGEFSTVTGGTLNKAKGKFSSVSGGKNKQVTGSFDWRGGIYFSPQ